MVVGVPFEYCFEMAQRKTNINKEILYTIAKIESNFKHNAKNKNNNGTVDYGIMQVNSYWFNYFRKRGYSKSYLLSPCGNILAGSYILKYCLIKKKTIPLAVECYNKGEKVRSPGNYYRKFKRHYSYFKLKNPYGFLQSF